jgi:hypothetical protein
MLFAAIARPFANTAKTSLTHFMYGSVTLAPQLYGSVSSAPPVRIGQFSTPVRIGDIVSLLMSCEIRPVT